MTPTSPHHGPTRAQGPSEFPAGWPLTAEVVDGRLRVGGVPLAEVAEACGTPVYVVDEADFRERARVWRDDSGADQVHYASKAFLCSEMVRWVDSERLHLDVCSLGELDLALAAGMDPARIVLHGNNKSIPELCRAVTAGVGVVVLDCFEEIDRLARLAREAGRRQDVYVRVTPGVSAATHAHIATGGDDVKFGFLIDGGDAERAALAAHADGSLRLVGLHAHLGSQLLEADGFTAASARVAALARRLVVEHDVPLTDLDLGGGAGIAYLPGQVPLAPRAMVDAMRRGVAQALDPRSVRLAVEPGRSLIGRAGLTLYRVGVAKQGPRRRFLSVDGGMSDALRPSLYGAGYTAWLADRTPSGPPALSVVVGRHCESGDVVVPDLMLPDDVRPGDLLAVPATGAYHHVMASNYNLQPRPAVVSVADGVVRTMVRRETPEMILARDGAGEVVASAAPRVLAPELVGEPR